MFKLFHKLNFSAYVCLAAGTCSLAYAETAGVDVDVTVVATRAAQPALDIAGSSLAVTADEISRAGAVSLGEALKYEPGVSVPFDFAGQSGFVPYLSGGDQSINIRGMEGNRVSLMVDGIRQPEDFVTQGFLGSGGPGRVYFDPAILSQLEIHKSAASSLYGSDALGGVVQAITESPRTLLGSELTGMTLHNSLTYATVNDSWNNRVAAAAGDGRWAASVVYSLRDGAERENNGEVDANPQDFTSHALVVQGIYQADSWQVGLTVDAFWHDLYTDADAAEGEFFNGALVNTHVSQEDERERLRLSLEGRWQPEGSAVADEIILQTYWQEASLTTENVQQATLRFGPFPSFRDRRNHLEYETEIYGTELMADKLLVWGSQTHALRYGAEVSFSEITSEFSRTDLLPSPRVEDRIGMAPSDVLRLGVYLRDEITLGWEEHWVLTPGLRLDYYEVEPDNTPTYLARSQTPAGEQIRASNYENTAFSPSISLMYRWTPQLNTYVSYARGIRNPSAEELNGVLTHGTPDENYIVVPNPDLKEERSHSYELGLQFASGQNALQLAGFYNFYDNFLEQNVVIVDNPAPEADIRTTVNRREVEIYGMELRWDWLSDGTTAWEGLEGGLSLGWSKGERTDVGQPLNSVDPWKGVAYAGYRAPDERWSFRLTGTYLSGKDESDIDHTTGAGQLEGTDHVLLLDATASYQFNELVGIQAGVANLTDATYTLWSSARRGSGHGGETGGGLNTQPGINGFVTLNVTF